MKTHHIYFTILAVIASFSFVRAQSTAEFINNTDTLVVYKDVPGLAPSDKYTIRVRSAATNNEWVQCFANYTYNRYYDFPVPSPKPSNIMAYIMHTGSWSHTYANVEMSENSPIEVEISKIGDALLDGVSVIEKSAVHPSHKVYDKRDENGKVYFKINKPCQVVIDINGQMDDHNAGFAEYAQIGPVHAISFFANPVIKKPATSGPGILYVTAGTKPSTTEVYETLVFGPGVHNIGAGFMVHSKRSYYIPGDAIVYGSFSNDGAPTPVNALTNCDGITFYGYGSISGIYNPHYQNTAEQNATYYPDYTGGADQAIRLSNTTNLTLHGITVIDPANFAGFITPATNYGSGISRTSWVKAITWRVNGDCISFGETSDCFYRVSDDGPSVGNIKRITFWKDTNGNISRIKNFNPADKCVYEDCDIIYHRRRPGATGAVWPLQNPDHMKFGKQILVDITLRNVRFHDRKADMPIFALSSDGVSYNGLKFENVSCYVLLNNKKNWINGTAETPWDRGIIFKNVTFNHDNGQPPVVLTKDNLKNYFNVNEYAKDLWFRDPGYFKVRANANPVEGTVAITTNDHFKASDTTYIEKSTVTLTATALPGYNFSGWTDDTTTVSNPVTVVVTGNKTLTANFVWVGMRTLTLTSAGNGTVAFNYPTSSISYNNKVIITAIPAIGYKFSSWTGSFTGTAYIDSLYIDSDKTITANFVKTNNFGVNYGGYQYVAADGTHYAQSGTTTSTTAITGTLDPTLYQSDKYGSSFSYTYPVDNGQYTVTLKFAETYHTAAARRVFNVTLEGTPILTNYDIFVDAGGKNIATDTTFVTNVADGNLNLSFTKITDNAKICAIKITKGLDISVSATQGGTATGGGAYLLNNSVTAVATAAANYRFVNWTENGIAVSTNPSYTFTVTQPRALIANFEDAVVINLSVNGGVGGTVSGGGVLKKDISANLTATPATNYIFVNWTENGVSVSELDIYTIIASKNRNLVANFILNSTTQTPYLGTNRTIPGIIEAEHYDNGGQGIAYNDNTTKQGVITYRSSTKVDIGTTAGASNGYVVGYTAAGEWLEYTVDVTTGIYDIKLIYASGSTPIGDVIVSLDGVKLDTITEILPEGSYNVLDSAIVSNVNITGGNNKVLRIEVIGSAKFNIDAIEFIRTHQIILSVNGGVGGTVGGAGTFNHNESISILATPAANYTFVNWTENGVPVSTDALYTFNVTQARNLLANFAQITHAIILSVNGGVGGTVSGAATYNQGQSATVNATPAANYSFVNWTENGVTVSTSASYTFTVSAARTLVANFTAIITSFDAYTQIEAESYNSMSGIVSETCTEGGQNVGFINSGDYIVFNNVSFGYGAVSFEARAASAYAGGNIEVWIDSPTTGTLVGTCVIASTGGWQTYTTSTCPISSFTGTHNLYLKFTGGTSYLFNLNWIKFTPASIPDVTALTSWVSGTTNNKVAGSKRLMTVMVMGESKANFVANGVTYGGQAMVKQSEKMYYVQNNRTYSSLFTLNETGVNAATSGTISVTWSATPTVGSSIYSVLLSNVDQTTPVSATANNGLTGTSISTSALAANTGDMVVMCGATENNITQTFDNGFTKQFESNTSWGDGVGGYKMGTGVSETPKFTQSASGRMALCAVLVKKETTAMRAPSKNTNVIDITNTSENSISIYPNPVSTNLNIDFSNADISRDVKVFNIFGQLVYSTKTKDTNIQINVQSLNLKGLVMVQILEGKTVVNHKVLLK